MAGLPGEQVIERLQEKGKEAELLYRFEHAGVARDALAPMMQMRLTGPESARAWMDGIWVSVIATTHPVPRG